MIELFEKYVTLNNIGVLALLLLLVLGTFFMAGCIEDDGTNPYGSGSRVEENLKHGIFGKGGEIFKGLTD